MPRADRGGSSLASFVLREAMVLDEGGGFNGPADIAVDGGVVVTVGRALRLDAPSYDFRGLWLLPGMVDCHLHAIATSLDTITLLRMPLSERILEATSVLKRTLEAGVTYARDAGGIDAGVRDGVSRGLIPGPDLQVAVAPLSQTGGHFDGYLPGPTAQISTNYQIPDYPGHPPLVADGADEVRKTVRLLGKGPTAGARPTRGVVIGCTAGSRPTGAVAAFDSIARLPGRIWVWDEDLSMPRNHMVRHMEHARTTDVQLIHVGERIYGRTGLVPPDVGERVDALASSDQSRDVLPGVAWCGD